MEQSNKLNLDEIIASTNRKYGLNLKDLLSDYDIGYKKLYIVMFLLAEEIRNAYFDIFPEQKENHSFNIYGLANALGIPVLNQNLEAPYDYPYTTANWSYYDQYYKQTIYVNKNIGDYSKRPASAISLSSFIINYIKGTYSSMCYSYSIYNTAPFISDGFSTMPHFLLATFIMMPMRDVFSLFSTYTSKQMEIRGAESNVYNLMEYLGEKFHISDNFVTYFFHHFQILALILYNYNGELGIDILDFCEEVQSYKGFFRTSLGQHREEISSYKNFLKKSSGPNHTEKFI